MTTITATLRAELAKAYEWGRMTAEQESPETLEQIVASGTEVVLNAVRSLSASEQVTAALDTIVEESNDA